MNFSELKERFHSDDLTQIDEGINWLLQSKDIETYSACLRGGGATEKGNEVQLAFDSARADGEESIIKEDSWQSAHGSYIVLRLLEKPLEGARYDTELLALDSLTQVGLKGVQFSKLPQALARCTSLRKLNLDDCEAIETLDDVRLLHAVIRYDAEWVVKAMHKITAPFSEVSACFQEELESIGGPFQADTPQPESHAERLMAIREWKDDHRPLPHLVMGLTLFQVKDKEEQPSASTQQIMDYLTENATEMVLDALPKVDVNEVQIAPIVAHLIHGLKQDADAPRADSVQIHGDWEHWYLSFLFRVSATNLHWYMTLVYDLPINAAISVFGGDTWCPKIMYNGSVIIRNHHRVIVPDYIGTLPLSDVDVRTFLAELDQFSQDFVMAVGTVEEEITLHAKPSELREEAILSGNNFITILHDDETVEKLHPAIQSWIAMVYENTRSGMMLRVVPGGISFYRTFRGDDSFDYALENLDVMLFNEFPIEEEMHMGYKVSDTPWSYTGVSWSEQSKMEDKYIFGMLQERFEYDTLDGSLLDFRVPELEKTTPFGFSIIDLLYSEFASFMKKDALSHFPYTQKIFSKNKDYPLGYVDFGKKKVEFMAAHGYDTVFTCPASYEMANYSMDLLPDLVGLIVARLEGKLFELNFRLESLSEAAEEEGKPLNPWGDISVFTEKNTMAVVTLPHACHANRREQIDLHFGNRVLDLHNDTEAPELSVRLDLVIGESGTTIASGDVDFLKGVFQDYVETVCEGDWSCFADEFWNLIQIYTRMPKGLLFEMEELGKMYTSIEDYDWFAEETSGLIGAAMNVTSPFAGTYQGFDSGDLDSGNM